MRIPKGLFGIVKEVARHLLRRPVVGIAALARSEDGRLLLVRRTDTGQWCLPGGTLEWGERLRPAIIRELLEEAGVEVLELGEVVGVYSDPARDPRFHAVTIVVRAAVTEPFQAPVNPMEIAEVRLFTEAEKPAELSHGLTVALEHAHRSVAYWE